LAKLVTATFDWDSGYRAVVRAEYVIDVGPLRVAVDGAGTC